MRKFKGKPINDTKENQVIRKFRHVDHTYPKGGRCEFR
jgi:hypothetical protein